MSAEAELYVREHSPFRGATFVVHRALAEMAYPDNGWAVWIDPARLASCWRLGERTVDRGRAELTKAGFLTRLDQPRWFRFEFPGALRQGGEDQARQGGEAPSPPRPPLPSTVVSNSSSKEKAITGAREGGAEQGELLGLSDPPSAVPTEGKQPRNVRSKAPTPFPLGQFYITPSMRQWLRDKELDWIDEVAETEVFRDWCLTHDKRYKDWEAAWRNWMRHAEKFAARDQIGGRATVPPPAIKATPWDPGTL